MASIRHFLKFLKENDVIAGNPAETIPRVRKEEKDPAVLFKNEYKALLFEAQGNRQDYAILLTFLKSGIRESELASSRLMMWTSSIMSCESGDAQGKRSGRFP